MKILIADDSKLVVSLISSLIKSLGENYQVLTASNGLEAITIAENEKPDLILMDWQMPTLSGLDALKKIKETPQTRHIPVIMLTASENTAEAFRYGATDFIQKPFQKEEFITRLRNILAAVKVPKENDDEKIKNEWLNLEAEKDRLRHLKDTLIRQKKELTQIIGKTQTLHHKFYIEPSTLHQIFPNHFVISQPLFDIPAHMIWMQKIDEHNIIITVCIFPNKGISAFLSAFVCEKILNSVIAEADKDLNLLASRAKAVMKTELGVEPIMRFFLIDPVQKSMESWGEEIPVYTLCNNSLAKFNTSSSLSFTANDILYIIQNGFLENIDSQNAHDIFFEYLLQHANVPFEKQKTAMEETIKNWQKELRQQNDILVVAVQLK